MKTKSVVAVGSILAMLFTLAWFAGAAGAQGGGTTVAGGFNGPMGVLVAPDGSI